VQEIVLMPLDIAGTLYVRATVDKPNLYLECRFREIRFRAVEPTPFSTKV